MTSNPLYNENASTYCAAADLLRDIVSIPSFSGLEERCSAHICEYLEKRGVKVQRVNNNIIARHNSTNPGAPVLLLNSHIDTVRPSFGYTFDPIMPPFFTDKVAGLGSNDAGGAVVSLIMAFLRIRDNGIVLPYNLILLLSAEEENSGENGISLALNEVGRVDAAIVGEPTQMKAAIAERGLLVIDAVAKGVSGHAARAEGINAIDIAINDILRLQGHSFDKLSPVMGRVKLTVTQIEAGTQHNVIPDICKFVVDIRPTDMYSNEQIMSELKSILKSDITARNLLNRSSSTPANHPLIKAIEECGVETYVSPTTSDWMRLAVPAIKMGPGDSARSHRADEYITVDEIKSGIDGYVNFLMNLKL
ncbi:MAG: M20/M25/M40 family metallo-hydrolase [Bacteroidales bacterium]|nr:M20/M25/M40 family metallo-hydrolase [Bacteroidales bacterium]